MTLKTRLTTAFATGAVLLNALAPLSFAQSTTIELSGNGAFSDNTANVSTSNDVRVDQDNDAYINNDVDVDANTGGNDANFNTGGDVAINTGDANVDVSVMNVANKNVATVDNCCTQSTDVLISGNGAYSDNTVRLDSDNRVRLDQDNDANIRNDVDVDADTGNNDANFNTGGDVSVVTGDADVDVALLTMVNANSAMIGGDGEGSMLSARILDNGAFSDNSIRLDFDNDVRLDQDNDANIRNDVDVDADTGRNDANFNTGGDVSIHTGDANVDVMVDTLANFNAADIDNCGCFSDVLAKIAGNGAFSDNSIRADFDNDLRVDQDNDLHLRNDVDVDADTGHNDAEFNTGESGSDPSIHTGDVNTGVELNNHSNVNLFNSGDDFEFTFDFHELLAMLMAHHS
jgi:hypothetical protein